MIQRVLIEGGSDDEAPIWRAVDPAKTFDSA